MIKIPLASAGLRQRDIAAAITALNSTNLTMGSRVIEFESAMAEYLKVEHFVMVNSGSSANLLIFEALLRPSDGVPKLKPGDGVIVPAVAWPTTIWPIIQLGLNPIFVDVDIDTLVIDFNLAQKQINERTDVKAIFPIHPLGFAIDHNILDQFCAKNNLIQINDVCESLGSWQDNVHAGTTGLASSFSFYFSHHITTMEGGGIATNNAKYADDLRSMRSHGWSRDRSDVSVWRKKYESNLATQSISRNHLKFQFITTGYNLRPMEIQAAIGLEQLKDLDAFILKRREVARYVKTQLLNTVFEVIDCGTLEDIELERRHSWMFLCLRVNKSLNSDLRTQLDNLLEKYGIESRPVLTGNFLKQPVMQNFKELNDTSEFPAADSISTQYFMVSAHQDLTREQIEYLAKSLKTIANQL